MFEFEMIPHYWLCMAGKYLNLNKFAKFVIKSLLIKEIFWFTAAVCPPAET